MVLYFRHKEQQGAANDEARRHDQGKLCVEGELSAREIAIHDEPQPSENNQRCYDQIDRKIVAIRNQVCREEREPRIIERRDGMKYPKIDRAGEREIESETRRQQERAYTLEEQRDLYETPEKLYDTSQAQEIERLLQDQLFFQTDLASQQQGRHSGYSHISEPTNLNQEQDD